MVRVRPDDGFVMLEQERALNIVLYSVALRFPFMKNNRRPEAQHTGYSLY